MNTTNHHVALTHSKRSAPGAAGVTALVVLATCVVLTLLCLARRAFIPVALALLFGLILSSAVDGLYRRGVPRTVGAGIVLLLLLGVAGLTLNSVAGPAQQWLADLPKTLHVVERKMRPLRQAIGRFESLTTQAASLGDTAAGAQRATSVATAASPVASISASDVVSVIKGSIASTMAVVVLTFFFLSGGPPMLARMAASLARDVYATHALKIIEAIRSELGRYYATVALINLGLGAATALTMMMLHMPTPLLWGTLAAVLNFIPYIGSATMLLVLTVAALVSFDSIGHIIAVIGTYLALATFEGQVVQPLFVGKRLQLNPLLVFLAVWLGGWLWGTAGIVLAVPALIAVKVAAERVRDGRLLVDFLAPNEPQKPLRLLRDFPSLIAGTSACDTRKRIVNSQ